MRARGLVASSELGSSRLLPGWRAPTLVVATSASGGAAETLDALRYPGDHDDDVRLLTEVLVPELVAARAWQAGRPG